jgi:hypothetical protein
LKGNDMGEVVNSNFVGAIINDCADANAAGRQGVEFQRLFGLAPTFIGVESYSGLEAAGNLADILDRLVHAPGADPDQEAVILVNAAPRNGKEKHDNGTPFCHFSIGKILVASTFDEESLAFIRDLGITDSVEVMSTPTVTAKAVEEGWDNLTVAQAERINDTQFRSLEFLPLVASWLRKGRQVPSETFKLADLESPGGKAWKIDNFGNVKTTLVKEDVDFEEGKQVTLADETEATCHRRLTDVPEGETAVTIGSSGFGDKRLLEIVIRKGRAADQHGIAVGSSVLADLVSA